MKTYRVQAYGPIRGLQTIKADSPGTAIRRALGNHCDGKAGPGKRYQPVQLCKGETLTVAVERID
jgi:hypothetical protein